MSEFLARASEMKEEVEKEVNFRKELSDVINRHSKENGSNTPDFILGEYLERCLFAFDEAIRDREQWYKGERE